jgi:hypothetical protein
MKRRLEFRGSQAYEMAGAARHSAAMSVVLTQNLCRALARVARLVVAAVLVASGCQAFAEGNVLSDITYRLGDGLRVPGLGLTLGGYATGTFDHLRDSPSRVALEDLSLSLWWEGPGRVKVFSEFDYENSRIPRASGIDAEAPYLALERLYLDYALSETATLRVGKFLTPIGRWNLIHATPLVWTTSRPLVTTRAFPTNVTGLMISGRLPLAGVGIDYSLYASAGHEFRPNPALDPFREAIGGHVSVSLPLEFQLGASYVNFEQAKTLGERKQLVGFDALWSHNHYELSAEAIQRFSADSSAKDEKGAFLQLVVPITGKLFAVGRYEVYRQAEEMAITRTWVAGLNYRLTHAIVLKAEWIAARQNLIGAPEGFMSSISVLF